MKKKRIFFLKNWQNALYANHFSHMCSVDNNHRQQPLEQQQQQQDASDDLDNKSIVVNDDEEENSSHIHVVDDDDSNELKNDVDTPTHIVPSNDSTSNHNNNNIVTNANSNNNNNNNNIEIDNETMEAMTSRPTTVNVPYRRSASLCCSSTATTPPSTSDGNENTTLQFKQWRRRLRTPVWARSLHSKFQIRFLIHSFFSSSFSTLFLPLSFTQST